MMVSSTQVWSTLILGREVFHDKVDGRFLAVPTVNGFWLLPPHQVCGLAGGRVEIAAMDFEIIISQKIFDRNSHVRFHKCMVATGLQKSLVHGLVHGQLFNHSSVTK